MAMEITLKSLKKIADSASIWVPSKPVIDFSRMIRFSCKDGFLIGKVANPRLGDLVLRSKFAGEEIGPVCIDAKQLSEYSKVISGEVVSVTLEGNTVHLESGERNIWINVYDDNTFPNIPDSIPSGIDLAEIERDRLINSISSVVFAASNNHFLLENIHWGGNGISAGDGIRMSASLEKLLCNDILTPKVSAAKVVSILKGIDSDTVSVGCNANRMHIVWEDGNISLLTVDKKFPNYEDMIPKEFKTEIVVDKYAIVDSLKAATVAARDNDYIVVMYVKVNANKLRIWTSSLDGKVDDEIPCLVSGNDMKIGFSSKYILESISAVSGDTIRIRLVDKSSQIVIDGDDKTVHIIMPMYIEE